MSSWPRRNIVTVDATPCPRSLDGHPRTKWRGCRTTRTGAVTSLHACSLPWYVTQTHSYRII
ncbi:hypothetical protein ANCDUO_26772 [Ancylostoma duodenale]|uniref:Uncharacterized protein n=1 Tax=Ancylostoma duodenale TaxID=51022 RepID=A0A0C2C0T8_9BILA|nr:hypothetical protein ANCDUO_26772 [Ancylostoma duodenale]